MRRLGLMAIGPLLLLGQGCVTGRAGPPTFEPQVVLPPLQLGRPLKRVVISDFFVVGRKGLGFSKKEYARWIEGVSYRELRERTEVVDSNEDLIHWLQAAGITARSPADAGRLRPGDLELRAMIIKTGGGLMGVATGIQIGFSCPTLFLYGLVLPYVVPISRGLEFRVRVELLDAQGRQVLDHRMEGEVTVSSRWITTLKAPGKPLADRVRDRVSAAIAAVLRPHLRRRRPGGSGRPRRGR